MSIAVVTKTSSSKATQMFNCQLPLEQFLMEKEARV